MTMAYSCELQAKSYGKMNALEAKDTQPAPVEMTSPNAKATLFTESE